MATRLIVETELFKEIGMVTTAGVINSDVGVSLRTIAQLAIQAALEEIAGESLWSCYRQSFGAFLKAPVTGRTLNFTQGAFTAVVSGATIDTTWIGGHVYASVNGYPQTVTGVTTASNTITVAQPFAAATNTAAACTMYFDGAQMPTACRHIDRDTMRLEGRKFLPQATVPQLQSYFGSAYGNTDYGRAIWNSRVIAEPTTSEPTCYTLTDAVIISSANRFIISVYPYPDLNYALGWQGYRHPATMTNDGTATDDAVVPDLPVEFHANLLIPLAKLRLADWPGYELTGQQLTSLNNMVQFGKRRFYSAQRIDGGDHATWRPLAGWV